MSYKSRRVKRARRRVQKRKRGQRSKRIPNPNPPTDFTSRLASHADQPPKFKGDPSTTTHPDRWPDFPPQQGEGWGGGCTRMMGRDEVRQLAHAAFDSEAGHALRAREARWLLVIDMAGNPEAAGHAMDGIADSPDGGAGLATAHLEELDEDEARRLTENVNRLAFTLCVAAADEAQAAAAFMLVKPEAIDPDTVALIAATEPIRQLVLARASAAGS